MLCVRGKLLIIDRIKSQKHGSHTHADVLFEVQWNHICHLNSYIEQLENYILVGRKFKTFLFPEADCGDFLTRDRDIVYVGRP